MKTYLYDITITIREEGTDVSYPRSMGGDTVKAENNNVAFHAALQKFIEYVELKNYKT